MNIVDIDFVKEPHLRADAAEYDFLFKNDFLNIEECDEKYTICISNLRKNFLLKLLNIANIRKKHG